MNKEIITKETYLDNIKAKRRVPKGYVGKLRYLRILPLISTIFAFAMIIVGIIYSSIYNLQIAWFILGCILFAGSAFLFGYKFKHFGRKRKITNGVIVLTQASLACFALEILTSFNPVVDIPSDSILFLLFVLTIVIQLIFFIIFNFVNAYHIIGNKFFRTIKLALLAIIMAGTTAVSGVMATKYQYSRFEVKNNGSVPIITAIRGGTNKKVKINLVSNNQYVLLSNTLFNKSSNIEELELNIPKNYPFSLYDVFRVKSNLKRVYVTGSYENVNAIYEGFSDFDGQVFVDDDKYIGLMKSLHEQAKNSQSIASSFSDFVLKLHSNQGTKFVTYVTFGTPIYIEPLNLANSTNWYVECDGYTLDSRYHAFDGWYEDKYLTGAKVSQTATFNDNVTLFGNWLKRYDINYCVDPDVKLFNLNGEEVSSSEIQYYLENAKTVQLYTAEKEGYHFAGWSTSTTATTGINELVFNNYPYNPHQDYSFSPVFEKIYKIKYFNGTDELTGLEPTEYYYSFGGFGVPTPEVTKTGYHFAGWKAAINDDASSYATFSANQWVEDLGKKYSRDLNFELVWAPNTLLVNFNSNGGQGTLSSQTFDYEEEIVLRANTSITKAGYTFKGWSTIPGGEVEYLDGATIDKSIIEDTSKVVTLYAVWDINTLIVKFDSSVSDSTGTMDDQTFIYTDTMKLQNNAFKKPGYHFVEWYDEETGTSYTNEGIIDQSIIKNGNKTIILHARWTSNTLLINFNSNNGKGSMPSQSFNYIGGYMIINLNKFTRDGYSFKGWSTTPDGEVEYTDCATIDKEIITDCSKVITLYAVWEEHVLEVNFDANGGDGVMEIQSLNYSGNMVLNKNTFTRTGYIFKGWAKSTTATVPDFLDGAKIDNKYIMDSSTTWDLYAVWEAKTYELLVEGFTFGTSRATYDQVYNPLGLGIGKIGYTLGGLTINGVDHTEPFIWKYDVESPYPVTPIWIPKSYNVDFDSNGGTSVASKTATYGQLFELPSAPTYEGYRFEGWAFDGVVQHNDFEWKYDSSKTAVAQWTLLCNVSFNTDGGSPFEAMVLGYGDHYSFNAPSKEGYEFDHWINEATGEPVSEIGYWSIEGDVTLKAIWNEKI